MRITTYGLRTQILAMFATGTLVTLGCGGSSEDGGGTATGGTSGSGATGGSTTGGTGGGTGATGGSGATGGYGATGATGGYGAGGGTGATGGAAGEGGATGGAAGAGAVGGAAGAGGLAGAGGVGGSGGSGGSGGLVTKGTVDCLGCANWESCWPKGYVPVLPNSPSAGCPDPGYVDLASYPYCNGNVWLMSGPTEDGGLCCYTTTTCVIGRPLTVHGEIRTAPNVARTDWALATDLDVEPLDELTRARLAEEWLNDARLEHASVAAFARLTMELLALGAPPELVQGAQESSLDEIEHAKLCYGIAARLGGKVTGPGRLPVAGALGEISLEELARSTFEEGCVGETIAALVAAAQARAARSGSLAKVIERIAQDESRHAAFAWRVVRWAVSVGGSSVAKVIEKSFERIMTTSAVPRSSGLPFDRSLHRAFGRIDADETARIRAEALRDVIAPCLTALLGEASRAAA